MAESVQPKEAIKHDWYQTEVAIVLVVLIKNVKSEELNVKFDEKSVEIVVNFPGNKVEKVFNLSRQIVPEQCSYKITPSKIELKLKKFDGGRWEKLTGELPQQQIKEIPKIEANSSATAPVASAAPLSYPTSKKGKDWSAIEKEIAKQEATEKPEGEEALNELFQSIYGKGSDEVKRAMVKSFTESGGTVLSTNWDEISKKPVDVKPPDGLEWKKWN